MTDIRALVLNPVVQDGLGHTVMNDVRPTARHQSVTNRQENVWMGVKETGQGPSVT